MTSSTSLLNFDTSFFSISDFISGWAAGIVATCVGHPLETIRVIQQVTNTSAINATREIYSKHKLSGYYRGMMFPILSTGIVNSIFFGINGNVMRFIQLNRNSESINSIDVRFCCDNEHLNAYWHLDVFMSACVGGFFCSLINIPSEVIKTMLQASNISPLKPESFKGSNKAKQSITSPIKLISELYKTNGICSLFRGGSLLMFRDVPSMGVYILSYEHVCSTMKKLSYEDGRQIEMKKVSMPKYIQIISGGIAGVVSWVSVLPFDVIKSKIIADSLTHPQYKGVWDCVRKTYREGGIARFYQGFWLVSLRAFPVNGVSLMVYEIVLNACGNYYSIGNSH